MVRQLPSVWEKNRQWCGLGQNGACSVWSEWPVTLLLVSLGKEGPWFLDLLVSKEKPEIRIIYMRSPSLVTF